MAKEPSMKQVRKLCRIVDPEWSWRKNWDAASAKLLWLKLKPGPQSELILKIDAPQQIAEK